MATERENRAKVDSLLADLGISRTEKDQIGEQLTNRLTAGLSSDLAEYGIALDTDGTVRLPRGGRLRRWLAARRRTR